MLYYVKCLLSFEIWFHNPRRDYKTIGTG